MGMLPLLEAISELGLKELAGSTVVDKIIGKAAALLISYFKAEEAFAGTISEGAIRVLRKNGVRYQAERTVKNILSKDGRGVCPFEESVSNVEDPEEGYKVIVRNTREAFLH